MLFSVVGIALVTTCICVLLKQWNPEISMMAALLCGILIFGIIRSEFNTSFGYHRKTGCGG